MMPTMGKKNVVSALMGCRAVSLSWNCEPEPGTIFDAGLAIAPR